MTAIFYITKHATGFALQSTEVLREQFKGLVEGQYKVVIDKVGQYERPSRYKFFFAVVMTAILEKVGAMFTIVCHRTGEQAPWRNTADVHAYMKLRYNPHTLITPTGIFVIPGSTTEISDRDFVNEYMEQIMADFSQSPYNVEFRDLDEWKAECKAKRERGVST